jgi:hypothetical protein
MLTNKQTNKQYASELYRSMEHPCRQSSNVYWQWGVVCSSQRLLMAVNLDFLNRSRYFFIQVAPQFMLTRLSGSRSRPTATQKI